MAVRNLTIVLGDQLDSNSAALDGFDKSQDMVWMAEVSSESELIWSHKARIALFLSAMRHFCQGLRRRGITVQYQQIDTDTTNSSFSTALTSTVKTLQPQRLILMEPGEWRLYQAFQQDAINWGLPLEIRSDRRFLCSRDEFAQHAHGRKQLRMEYFYRELRRRTNTLLEQGQPCGGRWNYDRENRVAFGHDGPGRIALPQGFRPDAITRQVLNLVERRFSKHPGSLRNFDWPVTPRQAQKALTDFVEHRLAHFGKYQDAMWTEQPFLYHSRLSAALNLKLLNPQDVIETVATAYHSNHAPLAAVEGFIRQVLGWREYVRGVYWSHMPGYLQMNALDAHCMLPDFYWTGVVDMECLRQVINQTLDYGYAHHIQRLMVTGLFALLLGVDPQALHAWYLAVYVDAVEWVELPNTLGMSQYADGGIMASKPYAATGKYIQRMSNYCRSCRYCPSQTTGDNACPFTTLYWDFLSKHEKLLVGNPRMALQLRNLKTKSAEDLYAISRSASDLRSRLTNDANRSDAMHKS